MSVIELNEPPIVPEGDKDGQYFNNVKRITVGNGNLRIENGAIIITDETGVDRVLIGFGEGLF